MPRTALSKNKTNSKPSISLKSIKHETGENQKLDLINIWITDLENEMKTILRNVKHIYSIACDEAETVVFEEFTILQSNYLNKTIGELRRERSETMPFVNSTYFNSTSAIKHCNNTTHLIETTVSKTKRKKSDDDGYLTAGDSRRSKSQDRSDQLRTSRTTTKTKQSVRRSKSDPRFKRDMTNYEEKKMNTPQNGETSSCFGRVTPKVKPNVPISVFRRPKQGEMAISLQGSPLLVSSLINETCANVNIPLNDGRIMSLQPIESMRRSEIPNIDADMRRQLEALRNNINLVVEVHKNL